MQQVLDEDQLWAMLIGQDGEILWGYDLPEDLPERYSLTDVASFSRWYLQDYPVQVWVREDGLLRHLAALDAPREPVMEQLSLFDGPGDGVP